MSRSASSSQCLSTRGFSLIEMLIALLFMSLMMAGMLRIYASSTKSFSVARESITAQRANRWALGILEDDLQGAGLFYPPQRLAPIGLNVTVGKQNPVMVLPNQTVSYKSSTPTGFVTETITYDEIQFLSDIPLNINAETASSIPVGSGTLSLNVISGTLSDLQAGDYIFFLDQNSADAVMVASAAGSVVTLSSTTPGGGPGGLLDVGASSGFTTNPTTQAPHLAGVPVMFLRPNMVVRYSIQPEALDPSDPTAMVPSLIREMAPYPTSGALMNWSALAGTTGYTRERIMSNASGLRIDLSLNAGAGWTRASATGAGTGGWGQMVAAANAQIATNPSPYNSISNPINLMWYRSVPALFRFDLQTRSSNQRTEASATDATLAYKTRTQTLFVSPRNFTFGL